MVEARDLCKGHYGRLMKFGDPDGGRKRKAPPPRSFSLRQSFEWYRPGEPPTAGIVWPWLGPTTHQGYGSFRHRGKLYVAHRVSYELFVGPIPPGHVIRHRNDTPIDTNPHNLETGTCAQNTADIWNRDRGTPPQGVINGQAKLTDDQVLEIRFRRDQMGEAVAAIARRFGMSASWTRRICNREVWRHIP